jgi:hypothetical protein
MSVKSAPFYWLECDACGQSSTQDHDVAAWADEEQARMDATEGDWEVGEDLSDLCPDCASDRKCPECGEPKNVDDTTCNSC